MKKVFIAVTAFVFAMSLFSVSFAAEKVKQAGTIKSMDAAKGSIVFCPTGTKEEIPIKADPVDLKGIKAGDTIRIEYEKGATNTATKIKKERKAVVPAGC